MYVVILNILFSKNYKFVTNIDEFNRKLESTYYANVKSLWQQKAYLIAFVSEEPVLHFRQTLK